jgi:hypothetical protein
MQQTNTPKKTSVVSAIIASVCIIVYLAALVFAVLKVYTSIEGRRITADREFFDLADLAASAGVLGFMDERFEETISDALSASITLEGLIITGPDGEYAFERERGRAINWVNNSPRLKKRFDFLQEMYRPLRIQGLRNVNIQAVAGAFDYAVLTDILKQTLLLVLAALTLSFFTLLLESLLGKSGKRVAQEKAAMPSMSPPPPPRQPLPATPPPPPPKRPLPPAAEKPVPAEKTAPAEEDSRDTPKGLYSPHGNIGWEEYTTDRLESELHRCASYEQDLVLIVMEWKDSGSPDENFFNQFADDAVNFFTLRDLIFEKGERGIAIIYPNIDLDMGFAKSEEFHNRTLSKYPGLFSAKTDLCIGISSRSGRLIDAERLIFEAAEALEKALNDPVSHIVAFKSDPEKYRAFIASQNKKLP